MKILNLLLKKQKVNGLLLLLLLMLSFTTFAQTITVKGTVSDIEDKMPIPGVSVVVKGTQNGVSTDFDGNYSIKAKSGDILIFSYLGMKEKAIKIKGPTLNVSMVADVQSLEEIVVIGYGTVKKKELTGAVARVDAEALEKIVTSDLGAALQGQISGVNIVSSSTPGGSAEILIRGITSVGDDNTPLYVVDGIIQDGDPGIPPSEIETINVLKDAASAAIYGARGATGVILITTKKGKAGTLKIRINGTSAVQVRNAAVPLMNSTEQLYREIVTQRNTTTTLDEDYSSSTLRNPYLLQNNTDLNDIIFNDFAQTHNYNTSISGGTEEVAYNVTMGMFKQDGLQLNSAYERFNVRSNTTYNKEKFRAQTSVGLSLDRRDIPRSNLLSQAIVYSPLQNGLDLDDSSTLGDDGDDATRLTWVVESLKTKEYLKTLRGNASLNLNYDINKNFSLSGNVGITYTTARGKIDVPYQEVINSSTGNALTQPTNSYIEDSSNERVNIYSEVGANFKKEIQDHSLNLGVFLTAEKTTFEQFSARRTENTNPDFNVLDSATGEQLVSSGFDYTTTRLSQIGRLQYSYKGKYNLSTSIRVDQSSIFDEDLNLGVFPSIAFAWNISDENFWKPLKRTVNSLKLRLSRGTVGNDRATPYSYLGTVTSNINYVGDTGSEVLLNGATQTSFVNPLLKWETSKQFNLGVDAGFFKNKLTLSAEYYTTNKEDMIFPIFLPTSVGGGNNARIYANVGNMTNDGVELAARYRHRIGKLWFQMSSTFATNRNEITKINGDTDSYPTNDIGLVGRAQNQSRVTYHKVGREAGAFYLWRTNGIVNTEEKLAEYQKIDSNAKMGDVIFIDQNGDNELDDDDRVYSGSGLPKFEIGYNFASTYKNFDFSMNWYAAIGHEIMNGFNAWAYGFGRHKDLIYQWSEANPETNIPAYRDDIRNHRNFIGYSDLWLENGSYLRLKQVTLGYSLPDEVTKKLGIDKLRIYLSSQNPLTFTNYSGYNPEVGGNVSSRGLDKGTGPVSVQYLAGINFNF
ncbi:TonB-linked outer membrane protein, SusC/RagA family [Polaribacter sp. KT25b]|uniref:SusC/RagA family TonB-linked outer membrane protein n=1 Tax=Polaribacter sp. KT25b TaxID=1855336 RepID=UPI00087B369D|nr:TonB-dependent receptor [Polaribacter sp. KT25b]SDR70692.1 TonB-linked outer membrane protein, SusC/RagA family [Polaribacter sp. KT25b]